MKAMKLMNGTQLNGWPIRVMIARFSLKGRRDPVKKQSSGNQIPEPEMKATKPKAGEKKQVWKRKPNKTVDLAHSDRSEDWDFYFKSEPADRERIERTVIGTLKGTYNRETLHNFLVSNGMSNLKMVPMGANEVELEFLDREAMTDFLRKGGD